MKDQYTLKGTYHSINFKKMYLIKQTIINKTFYSIKEYNLKMTY